MAKHFFLRWAAAGEHEWLVADGSRVSQPEHGDLTAAAAMAGHSKLTLLLPASWVVHTVIDVPAKGAAALRQAIPYALEDQFAVDVESLHFAIGSRSTKGVAVATVDQRRLTGVLQALTEAGLRPDRVVDEADLLAVDTLLLARNEAIFHLEDGNRAGCDHSTLPLLFADGVMPANLLHTVEAEAALQSLFTPPVAARSILIDGLLPRLVADANSASPINLLQGDFAPQTGFSRQIKQWRLPLAMAAVWLILLVGMKGADLYELKAQDDGLYAQVQKTFAVGLPSARMIDPRGQFERALSKAGETVDVGGGVALSLLDELAKALSRSREVSLASFGYRNNGLDVRLTMSGLPQLEPVKKSLEDAGLSTAIQATSQRNNKTEVRLRVAPAAEPSVSRAAVANRRVGA